MLCGLLVKYFLRALTYPMNAPMQDRRRTKSTTFCELCSPILLLCVLVYGYMLSDVLEFPEQVNGAGHAHAAAALSY